MKIKNFMACLILVSSTVNVCSASSHFTKADLDFLSTENRCDNCDLSNASLVYTNHSSSSLVKANLSKADASYSNFSQANFNKANLSQTNFARANLSQADFTGAVFFGANLIHANLYGSNISSEQLQQADNICNAILPSGRLVSC